MAGISAWAKAKVTSRAPLTLEVVGPTTLSVMVRLLFDKTMKGTQDFSLRIDESGPLGSRKEVEYAREILRHRTGADRQLAAYDKRHDLRDVVDLIIDETEHGIPLA